jgi:2-polyprenyl-3-methyl-5-hydroxy-6-metoxy-1,4-benzoquinol methylase
MAPVAQPDIASSTDDYAARFEGPGGLYMLDVQTAAVLRLLQPWAGATVLDVGGGHGQVCLPLAERGHPVTVLMSDPRGGGQIERPGSPRISRLVSDLLSPPLPDRSFDLVTCFRILAHVDAWEMLLGHLCDIAREAVLIDFPVPASANALSPLLFRLKKRVEKNTRPYALIRRARVNACLKAHGFECRAVFPQFFLPMVAHRMIGNRRISAGVEGLFRATGLTRAFGSPVILLAVRSPARRGADSWA